MWRKTPQTQLVMTLLGSLGHATNQELVLEAHKTMPTMSATTVHRITTRLVEAGMASYAPVGDGVKVIDVTATPHDHFVCRGCGRVVDIALTDVVIDELQRQIPGKLVRRSVVITGVCEACTQVQKGEA